MDIIRCASLIFIGVSGGAAIGGGVFALVTMVGIYPRLIAKTGTADKIYWYETMLIAGGVCGNLLTVFQIHVPLGILGYLLFGGFTGVYVGCLALALAEGFKLIPILVMRLKMHRGLSWIITAIALGKATGVLFQMLS